MKKNTTKWQQFNMLQEVITWFGGDPVARRSQNANDHCLYNPPADLPESIGCAIGMYLDEKTATRCDALNSADILPAWLKRMDARFLANLQQLHDSDGFWDSAGLSNAGIEKVKRICDIHRLPFHLIQLTPHPKTKS
jgi:hypothetical protein